MRHVIFEENTSYEIAILIKTPALKRPAMLERYIMPLESKGISRKSVIGFSLDYNDAGNAPVSLIRKYLGNLLPALDSLKVTTLMVCDGNYFKTLTGMKKAVPYYGYVLPCKIKGFEHMNVCLSGNYQATALNPDMQEKIDLSLSTLVDHINGEYKDLGKDVIEYSYYPRKRLAIEAFLASLHRYEELACDIEAFSLRHYAAGIGTIGFSWDQHHGGAFCVDYSDDPDAVQALIDMHTIVGAPPPKYYGVNSRNDAVRDLLREFFTNYKGKLIFHNIGYDAKVLIYQLWMDAPDDREGMLKGIDIMTRHFDDTQIIRYLSTNSCAGNKLSLKDCAHEFAGNWGQDNIHDIRKIQRDKLLEYNLTDCLATFYTKNKHYPMMVADQQLDLYEGLFKDSVPLLLEIELEGMPLVPEKVKEARTKLEAIQNQHTKALFAEPLVKTFEYNKKYKQMVEDNKKLKNKKRTMNDPIIQRIVFNPNSVKDLQEFLYEELGYPVIDRTKTKQPATGAGTIKKLLAHATDPAHVNIFNALIGLGEVGIILQNFINAFETKGLLRDDGRYYLHGSFKLGGTVSGRLSSSDPNMQNIPSGGTIYAKIIKECFQAPKGWVFCGADFASLEDRISALTTKDPMKLKVYTDGYDGHSLRAYSYFGDQMPTIKNTVESINSIAKSHKDLRQDSKAPTFLLTYGGTYHGMMKNLGWPEDKAKAVEAAYHEMYKVSDEWVADKIDAACKDGYVTVAFGLRVRTPVLKKSILKNGRTPYEAQSEARTAGNALGQSYGLLNNRAAVEMRNRILASPYRLDIRLIGLIHDAIYALVRDDTEIMHWFNNNLAECMAWDDLPEIKHPTVKLSGEIDVFYPSWANAITLPNGCSEEEIRTICCDAVDKYYEDKTA